MPLIIQIQTFIINMNKFDSCLYTCFLWLRMMTKADLNRPEPKKARRQSYIERQQHPYVITRPRSVKI